VNTLLFRGPPDQLPAETSSRRMPPLAVTAWVVVAVGILVGLTVWAEFDADTATGLFITDVVVGVAGCGLLPVLLRWPVAGALALAALAALSPAAIPPATVGTLHVAERRRFPVAVAVGVAGIGSQVVRYAWRPVGGLSFAWWLVLVIAGQAALVGWGALTRARRALVASLRERAHRAEAEQSRRVAEARTLERTRIAREMHDVLAHRLSLLATYAGAIEYRPDAPPEQLARAAGVVRANAHQALDELREVITVLRDVEDDDAADAGGSAGLTAESGGEGCGGETGEAGGRPQPGLADLPRLVGESRDAGTRVQVDDRVTDPAALPGAMGRTAYRVVQEGLTNARKHAAGRPVQVMIDGQPGGTLLIDICNQVPDDPAAEPTAPGTGTGLIGLTERVRLAGGELDHEITVGGEFQVHARLPWPA
jgi:signal transduction histidine kinase